MSTDNESINPPESVPILLRSTYNRDGMSTLSPDQVKDEVNALSDDYRRELDSTQLAKHVRAVAKALLARAKSEGRKIHGLYFEALQIFSGDTTPKNVPVSMTGKFGGNIFLSPPLLDISDIPYIPYIDEHNIDERRASSHILNQMLTAIENSKIIKETKELMATSPKSTPNKPPRKSKVKVATKKPKSRRAKR